MPEIFRAYENPPASEVGREVHSEVVYLTETETMAHGKAGRPKASDPKVYRYNFRLTEEQETRFRQMLDEAGMTENISKFILSRLFG